jgi:hypothetical protein
MKSGPGVTRPAVKVNLKGCLVVAVLISGRGLVGTFDAVQLGDARSFAFPDAVGNAVFVVRTAAV